jgi:hypothetical protein
VLSNDLRLYIRHAWHVIEPSTVYLENWHIDLIADYLQAVTAGQIKRLLINMPPRYAKSTCVSIMWPTWVWAREAFPGKPHNPTLEGPGTKWMFASYADELRTKHSLDRRKMLQSDWYKARWPKPAELTGDQNVNYPVHQFILRADVRDHHDRRRHRPGRQLHRHRRSAQDQRGIDLGRRQSAGRGLWGHFRHPP